MLYKISITHFLVLFLGMTISIYSYSETGNLPGGTGISVEIDAPIDGTVIELPTGVLSADVAVNGIATIGVSPSQKDTTLFYVIDGSGSMDYSAGVDCNNDGVNDPRYVCARVGVEILNDTASQASSTIAEVGLISFQTNATIYDVDLSAGVDHLVPPDFDGNGNSHPDVIEVSNNINPIGGTYYTSALNSLDSLLAQSSTANNIVLFLSDGENNGPDITGFVPTNFSNNTSILAYAVGTGVTCDTGGVNSLRNLATNYSSSGRSNCTVITDMSRLAEVVQSQINSQLLSLDMSVNGGVASRLDNSEIIPDLPQDGPSQVNYERILNGLTEGTYEVCATANGTDFVGSGSVTECVSFIIKSNAPPICDSVVADINELWPPNHKFRKVSLSGGFDPDGDPITMSIISVLQDEPTLGKGSGKFSPDAKIKSGNVVKLRAERSGRGNGRIYQISYRLDDPEGGSCMGSVTIGVPHDRAHDPIADEFQFDSTK